MAHFFHVARGGILAGLAITAISSRTSTVCLGEPVERNQGLTVTPALHDAVLEPLVAKVSVVQDDQLERSLMCRRPGR